MLREGRRAALHPRRPLLPLRRELARAPGRPRLEGGGPLPQVRRQAARGLGRRGGAAGLRGAPRGGAAGRSRHRCRRVRDGDPRLVPPQGPPRADGRRHPQPGAELRSRLERPERHLRLHRRGPGGVRRGDRAHRPARPREGGHPGPNHRRRAGGELSPTRSPLSSTARSSRARSSTSRRTPPASRATRARRSRATSRSRKPRTSPSSCASEPFRSSSR